MSKTAAQRKDAHGVATAVIAKAAVIVTHTIKDFSPEVPAGMAWPKSGLTPSARGCSRVLRRRSSLEYVCTRPNLGRTPMLPAQYNDYLAEDRLGMPGLALALASLGRALCGW